MPFHLDWSLVNTTLLLGSLAYLWKQSKVVDQVRQSLLGFGGQGGVLEEIRNLRLRSHELANAMTILSGSVTSLATEFAQLKQWDGMQERCHKEG